MWGKFLVVWSYFTLTPSFAGYVFWLPNKSIYLPTNFEDGKLPCPGQNIIFPESVEEGILISSLSINGLILPTDGVIILEEGEISFGSDQKSNCTRDGDSIYKDDQVLSWSQPDVWSSSQFNEATPDAERIPCQNDIVYFPKSGQFAMKLPDRPQTVQTIMEKESGRLVSLEELLNWQTDDQSQQFIESEPGMLQVSNGRLTSKHCALTLPGCPCQDYGLEIECELKYCPPPRCSYPIKPKGHCCKICGASLLIKITQDFDMKSFKDIVKHVAEDHGGDKLVYHVGLLPKKYGILEKPDEVQVVVLDVGEYTGVCKEVITDINYLMYDEGVKDHILLLSGLPSSQSSEGGKIVVIVFVLVVVVMSGLFAHYYKWSVSDLTELRGGLTRGMLSRLQRRTDSVISLARRDSTVSTATASGTEYSNPIFKTGENTQAGSAFTNPLFSSLRERVKVEAAVTEERTSENASD